MDTGARMKPRWCAGVAEATPDELITVPDDLDDMVDEALADHLRRALETAFPIGTAEVETRRARALLALRELATAAGRRDEGLPAEDLEKAIGNDGKEILERLATPLTRLVVPGSLAVFGWVVATVSAECPAAADANAGPPARGSAIQPTRRAHNGHVLMSQICPLADSLATQGLRAGAHAGRERAEGDNVVVTRSRLDGR